METNIKKGKGKGILLFMSSTHKQTNHTSTLGTEESYFCNSQDLRSLVDVGIIFFFSVISWVPQNQMDDMKKFDERLCFIFK